MKEKVKKVVITNERIRPDLKIVYKGKRYNVSIKNNIIPMIEDPDFVNYVVRCIELHNKCSTL